MNESPEIKKEFSNAQLHVEMLPKAENLELIALEKDYLFVRLIFIGIFWLCILFSGIIYYFFMQLSSGASMNSILLSFAGWILLAGLHILYVIKGFSVKGYALREKDITYRNGLLFRSVMTVPFNRIQHSEIRKGPIEGMFQLCRLKVYTAGGHASDLSIPGLRPEQAEKMKNFLTQKLALDEEE